MLPYRIAIRDLGDHHVANTEVVEPGKKPLYQQCNYIPKRSDVPTAEDSDTASLRKAWARFEERAQHLCGCAQRRLTTHRGSRSRSA